MGNAEQRLWPFRARTSLVAAAVLLVGLLAAVGYLRTVQNWKSPQSETTVLIGIFVLSLLPIALALLEVVMQSGAVIEFGGVKLAFSRSQELGTSGLTIAANVGLRGEPVSDSGTIEILATLKQASAHRVAIIDQEAGNALWETRLFVLLAGADRRRRPDKTVIVPTDAKKEQQFQGCAHPQDHFPLLAKAHPQYERQRLTNLALVGSVTFLGASSAAAAN